MNTSEMMPTEVGRLAELDVKRSLWQRNYRVKDVSRIQYINCDLIVNDKYKVEIKSMRGSKTSFLLTPSDFDVLAVVQYFPLGKGIYYLKDKTSLEKMHLSNTKYHVNTEILTSLFTKRPQSVFL